MKITTIEQLKEVKIGDVLFLINPFSNGNQEKVLLEKFTVQGVYADKFNGRRELKEIHVDRVSDNHFSDMLSGCKYAYTVEGEALEKLKDVRKGLHSHEVNYHHESCTRDFDRSAFLTNQA